MLSHVLLALPVLASFADARMHVVRRGSSHHHIAARQTADNASADATVAAAWFEGWSSNFTVSDVPWEKYTHVTYSFAYAALLPPFSLFRHCKTIIFLWCFIC